MRCVSFPHFLLSSLPFFAGEISETHHFLSRRLDDRSEGQGAGRIPPLPHLRSATDDSWCASFSLLFPFPPFFHRIDSLTLTDDLRPPAEEETKQTARTAGKAAAKERKKIKEEAAAAAALSAGSASADDTATDGTEGTLGETDGTLPLSSPHAANVKLEGLTPAKAKKVFVEDGVAPLPEGLAAEGQAYCPPVKEKKKTPAKKRAPKVKAEEVDGEEKPAKAKTPRKRKSAAATEEGSAEDGEDVKPVVKKPRKTPVKKAKKATDEAAATTTDDSAHEADHEATPAKKHKKHRHHHSKDGDVKPELEVGGLEEVAMEVAKE
jgi:hypothetical protein